MTHTDDPTPRPWTRQRIAIEAIGWAGTLCLLTAFLLNTMEILGPKNLSYLVLNMVGAAGVGFNAYIHRTYPALAIEALWVIIAAVGIGRYFLEG